MTAYTDYNITQKKLELLRNQERFFNSRIKELEQKKSVIEQTKIFIDNADRSGLFRKNWDEFSVDLKDEPVSFSQLKALLYHAGTADQYYFLPESLVIQPGGMKKNPEKKEEAIQSKTDSAKSPLVSEMTPAPLASDSDTVISLKGIFLVRQGRQDE